MAIDIKRNYVDTITEDEREKKQKHQEELDRMMKEFLAKGGKVEKCEPGAAKQMSGFMGKPPQYSDAEIKRLAKERKENGSGDSETPEWYNE
jgi:hypothetical protein